MKRGAKRSYVKSRECVCEGCLGVSLKRSRTGQTMAEGNERGTFLKVTNYFEKCRFVDNQPRPREFLNEFRGRI